MEYVRLHRPWPEALRFNPFHYRYCHVLVPRNFPIRLRYLVEENPSHRQKIRPQNRLNKFAYNFRI